MMAMRRASLITLLLYAWSSHALAQVPTWVGSWSGNLCSPRGVAILPNADILVASDCQSNTHVERFTSAGSLVTMWSLPGSTGSHWPPNGLAVDAAENVYVTDSMGSTVDVFSITGAFITKWGALGDFPVDLAVDAAGLVYVTYLVPGVAGKLTNTGTPLALFGSTGTGVGQLSSPQGIAVDGTGHVYVADNGRQRILRFTTAGPFELEFDPGAPPSDVAVGPDGNLYVVSFYQNLIRVFSPNGAYLFSFTSPNRLDGAFRIAISSTGGIFVTEQLNNRVTKFQMPTSTAVAPITFGRLHALYR